MRWAQLTHDWMERLWKTPDGGKLGLIFFSLQMMTNLKQDWRLSPLRDLTTLQCHHPGSEALAVRLVLCTTRTSHFPRRKDVVYGLRTMSQKELTAIGRLEVDSRTE